MFRKKKSSEKLPTSTAPAAAAVGEKKSAPDQEKESVQTSAAKQTTVSAAAAVIQPQEKPVVKNAGSTAASQKQTLAPTASSKPPAGETATVSPKLVDKTARKAKGAKGFFKRAPTIVGIRAKAAEATRLKEDMDRVKNWKRWGPYLSERQWATVREDYSPDGSW